MSAPSDARIKVGATVEIEVGPARGRRGVVAERWDLHVGELPAWKVLFPDRLEGYSVIREDYLRFVEVAP